MSRVNRVQVAKDAILFSVGVGGIVYQLVTGQVNFGLLAVFTAMTGIPGVTNFVSLLKGGVSIESAPSSPASPRSDSDS